MILFVLLSYVGLSVWFTGAFLYYFQLVINGSVTSNGNIGIYYFSVKETFNKGTEIILILPE